MKNPIMQYFAYEHLPPTLQTFSKPFADVATHMDHLMPDSPEKSAGMRKLLEAKDCFVRAGLSSPPTTTFQARLREQLIDPPTGK